MKAEDEVNIRIPLKRGEAALVFANDYNFHLYVRDMKKCNGNELIAVCLLHLLKDHSKLMTEIIRKKIDELGIEVIE